MGILEAFLGLIEQNVLLLILTEVEDDDTEQGAIMGTCKQFAMIFV